MNKDFIEILREFIPNVPVFTPKYGMIFTHVFSWCLLSVSIVRSFMWLTTFHAHWLHVAAPECMHCVRWWPPPVVRGTLRPGCGVSLGSSPFQLFPLLSYSCWHRVHPAVRLYPYLHICCPHGNVPVTTWSSLLRCCHGIDLFFSHVPISSRLDPSLRKKSVHHVRVAGGLPSLSWCRSSKHCMPHSCSLLNFPLLDAVVPSFDALIQC